MGKNRQNVEEKQDLLPGCLFVLSVLTQFRHSIVRDDLISGQFTFRVNSSCVTLEEIDALHDALFPSFHLSCDVPMKMRMKRARSILEGIVNLSREILHLDLTGLAERTHSDWFCILSELEGSSYWGKRNQSNLFSCSSPQQLPCFTRELIDSSTNTDCVESKSVALGSDVCSQKSVAIHTDLKCTVKPERNDLKLSKDNINTTDVDTNIAHKTKVKKNSNKKKSVSVAVITQSMTDPGFDKSESDTTSELPSTRLDAGELHKVGDTHIVSCDWCHKLGHTLEHCWRRLRLCLICGGKHKMTLCPRYVAPIDSSFVPTCSLCNGRHLGKYCGKRRQYIHLCHWCGKRGHEESHCWVKNRCCLICGDPTHKLTDCSHFETRQPLVSRSILPPWRTNCGDARFGTCEDPYME
jgi:hypothetical protein